MIRLALISLALATASISATGCGPAAPAENHAMRNGYSYLGERFVHGGGQEVHEAIAGLRGDGAFTSIMLVVEDAPVEMDRVVITFGDGQKQEVGTRLTFGADSTTREIPLEGGARHLRRVDFVFNNFPGNGHAKVELWGR
jgi:hypothetical protein